MATSLESNAEKVKVITPFKHMLQFETKVRWRNVIIFTILHLMALYGAYLLMIETKFSTFLFAYLYAVLGGLGVTAGAHRLFSHKSYKAHWSLRTVLAFFHLISLQEDLYTWCRNHRVHHKFSETDADPHNSNRGFFFAHMGWLMCEKHPEVIKKGATVSCEDLLQDPVVYYQKKYYYVLSLLFAILMPTAIPVYCWGETWRAALFAGVILRLVYLYHCTWLVNSVAHLTGGEKVYDVGMNPRENMMVTYLTHGEGYHNYHHSFPFDYAAAELGPYEKFNLATMFIDGCAGLGLATDRKRANPSTIKARVERTGDVKEHEKVLKSGTKFSVVRCFLESFINPSVLLFLWIVGVLFLR